MKPSFFPFNFLLINIYFNVLFTNGAIIPDDTIFYMATNLKNIIGEKVKSNFMAHLNRSCVEDFEYVLETQLIFDSGLKANELCYNWYNDFSSSIADFYPQDFMCSKKGTPTYDYFSQFGYCINCRDDRTGAYCVNSKTEHNKYINASSDISGYLYNRTLQQDFPGYLIDNVEDLISYLSIIESLTSFYSISFKDNDNDYFFKYDFLSNLLFNYISPSLNISNPDFVRLTRDTSSFIVGNSLFSLDFNILKFISLFVSDDREENYSPFYGKISKLLDKRNEVYLGLGNQNSLDFEHLLSSFYYGTGGYAKFSSVFPNMVIPDSVSNYLYNKYYTISPDGTYPLTIKYVFTYVFNPRTYYTRPGYLMKTPIVSIKALSSQNPFKEFFLPDNDFESYDFIKVVLPWSRENPIFVFGDFSKNCRIMTWNELARQWFPTFNSHIDFKSTTLQMVTFFVKQFGTYAVYCDNLKKIFDILKPEKFTNVVIPNYN